MGDVSWWLRLELERGLVVEEKRDEARSLAVRLAACAEPGEDEVEGLRSLASWRGGRPMLSGEPVGEDLEAAEPRRDDRPSDFWGFAPSFFVTLLLRVGKSSSSSRLTVGSMLMGGEARDVEL